MTLTGWKYAFASVIGTSHVKVGLPCQDRSECAVLQSSNGTPVFVAVVSDGAGSAQRSEVGASLACSLFIAEMNALIESGGEVRDITHDFIKDFFTRFQNEVRVRAEAEELPVREFACTLLGAVVDYEKGAFFQIGDGAIVMSLSDEPEDYQWIFWPQKGAFVNITNFATDEGIDGKFEYEFVEQGIEEIAIFTDGIEHLALQYQPQLAFVPFFRPMFSPLRSELEGHNEKISQLLASFLESDRVNSRTNDDKTLILGTRRYIASKSAVEGTTEGNA